MAMCQAARSPASISPGNTSASRSAKPLGRVCVPALDPAPYHIISGNMARPTRQNAVAIGPTSDRRTKIGEQPMATPPTTSAASAQRCERKTADAEIAEVVISEIRLVRPESASLAPCARLRHSQAAQTKGPQKYEAASTEA